MYDMKHLTKFKKLGELAPEAFNGFGSRLGRVRRIRSSAVRSPADLFTHLILRLHNEAVDWQPIEGFFTLYCDISDDRGFKRSPCDQFRDDLGSLLGQEYICCSTELRSIQHGHHVVHKVPALLKIGPRGIAHIRDANSERQRAGL